MNKSSITVSCYIDYIALCNYVENRKLIKTASRDFSFLSLISALLYFYPTLTSRRYDYRAVFARYGNSVIVERREITRNICNGDLNDYLCKIPAVSLLFLSLTKNKGRGRGERERERGGKRECIDVKGERRTCG